MCRSQPESPADRKTNAIRTKISEASPIVRRTLLVEVRKLEALIKNDAAGRLLAELQDLLLKNWNEHQKQAINEAIQTLAGGSKFRQQDLDDMTRTLDNILGRSFASAVQEPLHEIDRKAYGLGLTGSIASTATFNMVDQRAMKWLDEYNMYWVQHHYSRNLNEDITKLGKKALEEGLTMRKAGEMFEAEFAERLDQKSWRYWQGYANTVITDAREFGAVSRYEQAGVETLQVKAVLDHRTSAICRSMHNRIISVTKAREYLDARMAAETPEAALEVSRYQKPDDITGVASASLPNQMSLPPYHFGLCRTDTIAYTSASTIVEGRKSGKLMKAPKNLQAYSNEEYSAWISDIKARKRINYGSDDLLGRHMKNHGSDFGLGEDDREGYKKIGRDIVKESDSVFARIYEHKKGNPQLQFVFFGKQGQAVVGDDMQLHGIFSHSKPSAWQKAFDKQKETGLWLELKNNK